MVTKTVETVQTVEEDVTCCNECGREWDKEGREYIPVGEILSAKGIDGGRLVKILETEGAFNNAVHACSECREQYEDSFESPHITRVEDWTTLSVETMGIKESIESSIDQVLASARFFMWAGIIIGAALVLAPFAGFTVPALAGFLYGIGGLLAIIAMRASALSKLKNVSDSASRTVERNS